MMDYMMNGNGRFFQAQGHNYLLNGAEVVFGIFLFLLVIALLTYTVIQIVLTLKQNGALKSCKKADANPNSVFKILDERLAKGEIGVDEYLRCKTEILRR